MISEAQFAGNLGLAILLGALVGLEREVRGHDAGIKTNSLVSGGAAVFMMLSVMFTDGGRIAAQVVTGIGFLGAGNIMRAGDRVRLKPRRGGDVFDLALAAHHPAPA